MSVWTMPLPGLMRKKAGGLNVADVFKTTLYTGNGGTQTIETGMAPDLVWIKDRTSTSSHGLFDTARGAEKRLSTNLTAAEVAASAGVSAFNSDGFSLGSLAGWNGSGASLVSWTFRRAKKFFDIVTYTGNGTSGRQISHGLGIAPGFLTAKSLSTTGNWNSYHRSATGDLVLNSPGAQTGSRAIITAADASTFTVSGVANTNGVTYVAYLFAHDPSPEGIIQCGSYTGNDASSRNVDIGWAAQYILIKARSISDNWYIFDAVRGFNPAATPGLYADLSASEDSGARIGPYANGFTVVANHLNLSGYTYTYMAIRAEGV